MKRQIIFHSIIVLMVIVLLSSCGAPGNNDTGSEYMPDMAHSIAYEANVNGYYYNNTWDSASVKKRKVLSIPGLPVNGTIPRGYASLASANSPQERAQVMANLNGMTNTSAISIPVNGHVPYYYDNTEEDRLRATAEMINNPFPITEEGLAQGKALYDIFCGICHGIKGDGLGYLVSDDNPNAKYPAQPANLIEGDLLNASNGRYYFAIMHGKNVMGGYADKISYEERWNVIHHIKALQAKATGKEYTAFKNTLNDIEIPGGSRKQFVSAGEQVTDTGVQLTPDVDTGIENPTGDGLGQEAHPNDELDGDHSPDGDHSNDNHDNDDHAPSGGNGEKK